MPCPAGDRTPGHGDKADVASCASGSQPKLLELWVRAPAQNQTSKRWCRVRAGVHPHFVAFNSNFWPLVFLFPYLCFPI